MKKYLNFFINIILYPSTNGKFLKYGLNLINFHHLLPITKNLSISFKFFPLLSKVGFIFATATPNSSSKTADLSQEFFTLFTY